MDVYTVKIKACTAGKPVTLCESCSCSHWSECAQTQQCQLKTIRLPDLSTPVCTLDKCSQQSLIACSGLNRISFHTSELSCIPEHVLFMYSCHLSSAFLPDQFTTSLQHSCMSGTGLQNFCSSNPIISPFYVCHPGCSSVLSTSLPAVVLLRLLSIFAFQSCRIIPMTAR